MLKPLATQGMTVYNHSMTRNFIGRRQFKGRGAISNPSVRFEALTLEQTYDGWYAEEVPESLNETVLPDRARSVITTNDSPDVGFDKSINPYRGCSHGCVYCFARPTHAYLGLSPGLDFETKLFYKAMRSRCSRPNSQGPGTDAAPSRSASTPTDTSLSRNGWASPAAFWKSSRAAATR